MVMYRENIFSCFYGYLLFLVPSASPQNVNAFNLSSMDVMVTWEEVPEIDQNGIIIQYEVLLEYINGLGEMSNFSNLSLLNPTQLSLDVTGIEGNILYNVSVRAFTSVGPGPYSNTSVQVMTVEGGLLLYKYLHHHYYLCSCSS